MGMKYMINAFNYPYQGYEKCKQTKIFIIAVFWFTVLSIKYDGVDIQKRVNKKQESIMELVKNIKKKKRIIK